MRVLVGRPQAQAEATARSLAQRGHEAIVAPVLAVVPTGAPVPDLAPAAILVTSTNAVPALAGALDRFRTVPIHAVGRKTAAALLAAGFTSVHVEQDGHGKALARAIGKALPRGEALLHAAGADRREEPELSLRRAGFALTTWETYEARPVAKLPEAARAALAENRLDTVLHYSPRSAEILVRLAEEAGLTQALRRPVHLCLSRAVAAALADLGPTRIAAARRPEETALLDLIDRAHVGPIDARARARLKSGVREGTNPPSGTLQPAKDDRTPMSDTRRDPLRRTPPTIDLKAEVVPPKDASAKETSVKDASVKDVSKASAGKTAEAAATKPDSKPPEANALGPKAADAKPQETKTSGAKASTGAPSDAKPPETKPAAGAPAGTKPDEKTSSPAPSPTGPKSEDPKSDGPKSDGPKGDVAKAPLADASAATAASSPAAAASPASPAVPPSGKPTGPAVTPAAAASASATAAASATGKPNEAGKPAEPAKAGSSAPPAASPKGTGTASPSATSAIPGVASAPKAASATPSTTAAASEKPASAPDRSPPPAAAKERGGAGAGTVVTAGIVGGVLGAVLVGGALHVMPQLLPQNGGLTDRLDALERRIAAPGALEPRIAALESALRQAGDDARAARAAAETAGKQAAEALARPAGQTTVAGPDQEARASIQEVRQEARGSIQALGGRVDEAAKKTDANTTALADLGGKIDTLATKTTEGLASGTQAIEALNTHVRSLQTDVGTLRTGAVTLDTRAADAEKRLTTLTDGLGRVTADLAKVSPAAIQAGLRVVVAGRLDDALRSGSPLKPAIAALAKLGTEQALLAPLQPYAETAAPSAAALAAEFKPLADTMTAAPPQADETWLDRGKRVLGKVVTVRSIGDGSGTDVPGLIARIEGALGRGDVGAAKAAWDKLPEDKRKLSAAWGQRLGSRAAAEDAARRIGAQSLAALDAATR